MNYKEISFTIPKCFYCKEDKQYHDLSIDITLFPRKRHLGLQYEVLGSVWENYTRQVIKRLIVDYNGISEGIKKEKRELMKDCKKVFNKELSFITRKKALCHLIDYWRTHKKMRSSIIPH